MENKDKDLRSEINAQLWILNAVNRAIMARQQNKDGFSDAVSGAWLSLFPNMKEDLVEKLDEAIPDMSAKEIRDYNKDGFETSYDLQSCIKSKLGGNAKEVETKAGEILLNKIQEVVGDWKLLGTKRKMPSFDMRKRRLSESEE